MKILHLVDEPWDSGLTQYALQAADSLRKAGHDIVVGAAPGKKPEALAQGRGLGTAPIQSLFSYWKIFNSENWDVINAHTGRTHTRAILYRNLSGRPIAVVRTRGDARPVPVNAGARFILKRTDGVISASDHIGKQYEEGFNLTEDRHRVIYPAVEADETFSNPPADKVGMLGRLDPVKGHSFFLEAAAYVLKERPGTEFLIAGKEATVSVQMLKNQARVLGIENRVRFLGFHPSAKEFMRSCSLGVIASIGSEEISRACLEWMAAGRTVVATLVGSLPELVEPEETGFLVPPGDALLMSKDILGLLNNKDQLVRLGQKSLEVARRKFNQAVMVRETLDLYSQALHNARML